MWRLEIAGGFYHVLARGNQRKDFGLDEVNRQFFLRTLGEACGRTDGGSRGQAVRFCALTPMAPPDALKYGVSLDMLPTCLLLRCAELDSSENRCLFVLLPPMYTLNGLLVFCLAGVFLAAPSAQAERVKGKDVIPERELFVTAPSVLEAAPAQYPGPWSFGGLLERLLGKEVAAASVSDWLETWTTPQTIDQDVVRPRPEIVEKLIAPWQKRDGYVPKSEKPWVPKLANAPFRLLAIVNRIDLCAPAVAGSMKEVQDLWKARGREKEFNTLMLELVPATESSGGGYGFSGTTNFSPRRQGNGVVQIHIEEANSSGEGRFVFGAVDDAGQPLAGGFTVILEYVLTGSSSADVREWARRWHALGSKDLTDPAYVAALQEVTRGFTHAKDATLGQLRTSEACFGPGREFRQFQLSDTHLSPVSLTQTPAFAFSRPNSPEQRALGEFLHAHDQLIRNGIHQLPSIIGSKGKPTFTVLAGSAIIPTGSPGYYWDPGTVVSRDARRIFSLNTCTGCHGGETTCAEGLHVQPRAAGAEAAISTFLNRDRTPLRVNDPDTKGQKVQYEEMSDRASILAALLEPSDRATIRSLLPILRDRLSRTH